MVSAGVYTANGTPFAAFRRQPDAPLPALPPIPSGQAEARTISLASVVLARRIVLDDMPVGVVVLEADMTPVFARFARNAGIALIVLCISLGATLAVSRVAQRVISAPIRRLGDLARQVSEDNDFHVRAPREERVYELALLTDAFNEMLGGLEARERWLQEAHEELEARVQQRTAELQVANQELESFSYSVSHDLRAPLRHVAGFANLLQQHAGDVLDDKGRRYITTIVDSAARMGRLIDDLLAFSRMGRATLTKQKVDLDDLVREVRAEVEQDAAGRTIEWTVHPLPTVDGDRALLRAALTNLLSNALKYTGTRDVTRIEVGVDSAADGGDLVMFVRDNGVGFDMAYAHKLFGVFQRLHASNEFSGTGIGLANVRRIIQRHGGRTWATGEVGVGATFFFSLPAATALSSTTTASAVA
jgi:signal transduction histidine kinase